MPFGMGAPELLIILAIVVVLFGASRIGDIGKGVGRGIREFRREIKDATDEGDDAAANKVESTTAPGASVSDDKPTQTH